MAINIAVEAPMGFCPVFAVLSLSGLVLFSLFPLYSVLGDCVEKCSWKWLITPAILNSLDCEKKESLSEAR